MTTNRNRKAFLPVPTGLLSDKTPRSRSWRKDHSWSLQPNSSCSKRIHRCYRRTVWSETEELRLRRFPDILITLQSHKPNTVRLSIAFRRYSVALMARFVEPKPTQKKWLVWVWDNQEPSALFWDNREPSAQLFTRCETRQHDSRTLSISKFNPTLN